MGKNKSKFRLMVIPAVFFVGGLAFLIFSLCSYQTKSGGEEFNPTHSSRILTLKLRLNAFERAKAQGKTDYTFKVNEAYPMYNPFEGANPDEFR